MYFRNERFQRVPSLRLVAKGGYGVDRKGDSVAGSNRRQGKYKRRCKPSYRGVDRQQHKTYGAIELSYLQEEAQRQAG